MSRKRKQEREEIEFDEEDEAPAYVPPAAVAIDYKQFINGQTLTQQAREHASKIFGLHLPGNPYIELNRIFCLKKQDDLNEQDKVLFERKENPVTREIVGKNLLLWNFIYFKLKPDESFAGGRMDDAFLTKMTCLEMKVTFYHNAQYPEYEHGVNISDCRILADHIGHPITKEQQLYGHLYKRGNRYPHIPFKDFYQEMRRHFVTEPDIRKWNIFGPDVLRGHPLEHADPYVHCLAKMTVAPSYKSLKVILADECLRLRIKITINQIDKRYEVATYARMVSTLIGELYPELFTSNENN